MANSNKYEILNFLKNCKDRKEAADGDAVKVEARLEDRIIEVKTDLKSDIIQVKVDLLQVKTDLENNNQQVKTDLENNIREVKMDLETDIREVKTDLKDDIKEIRNTLRTMTNLMITCSIGILAIIVNSILQGDLVSNVLNKLSNFLNF